MSSYKYLILFLIVVGILFFGDVSHAWDQQFGTSGICDKKATSGSCNSFVYAEGGQAYRDSGFAHADGHGSFGPSGGVVSLHVCLSRSWAMWDGACWQVVNNLKIGDGNVDVPWDVTIGNDPHPNFFVGVLEFYANDATWIYNHNVNGRRVEVTSMNAPSSVAFGDNIHVSWGTDQSWETYLFTDEGVPSGNSQPVEPNGSRNFTANSCWNCTAYFTIRACGPSGGGWTCNYADRSTWITEAFPGPFSINSANCTNVQNGTITVSWQSSANATHYELWGKPWTTGAWNVVAGTGGTGASFDTAHNRAVWYVGVRAFNSAGNWVDSSNGWNQHNVSAQCPLPNHALSVNSSGASSVSISSSTGHGGVTNYGHTIAEGTGVALTAPATHGFANFSNWSGCDSVNGTTCNLTMNSGRTATVNYVIPNYNLSVNSSSISGVSISSSTGHGGTTNYNRTVANGTGVALTAPSPVGGFVFSSWSGCDSVNGTTCNLTVTGNRTATVDYVSIPTTSNVSVTEPDYCISGPAITVNWTYSDSSGSPQSAYQVQISRNDEFTQIDADSGKQPNSGTSWFSGQGLLQSGTVYRARARTWNQFDVPSDWQLATTCNGPGCTGGSGNWRTPNYHYPQVDFTWESNGINENPSPPVNEPVQFTDQTVFGGGSVAGRDWLWLFNDPNPSPSSTQQNPSHTYTEEGTYYVSLEASDSAGQTCKRTRGPLFIQKPIPIWIEVAPR